MSSDYRHVRPNGRRLSKTSLALLVAYVGLIGAMVLFILALGGAV